MFPSNSLQSKRWLRCRNVGEETIPPHAILRLVDLNESGGGKRNRFFNQELHEQQVVWRVDKPNAESIAAMDSAMFVVNGPQSILPGRFGQCSRDWPLPVLHDGSEDDLVNGAPCGPADDQWWVASSGFCFTCLSHDIAGRSGQGDIHTAWIAPSFHQARKCGVAFGGASIPSGAAVGLSGSQLLLGLSRNEAGDGLLVDLHGLYCVAFACTLTAPSAPRGATLTLKLYLDQDETGYSVSRAQDIELDAYGAEVLTTSENVAAPMCLLDVDKDQMLQVKNTSAYGVSVTNFWLSALRLGPRSDAFDEAGSGLVYP
jgi:hypothetical protein